MDVVFAEPAKSDDDQSLEEALRSNGQVVLASTMDRAEDPAFSRLMLVEPLPRFKGTALDTGLALLTPDPDGTIRRFVTRLSGMPTLSAAAFGHLEGSQSSLPGGGLVDHIGPPRSIRTVSYTQVLDDARPLPPHVLQDKIALVGRSLAAPVELAAQADTFRTPFSRETGMTTAGVELHATILASLLSGRTGAIAPGWGVTTLAFFLIPCSALLLSRRGPLVGALASVAIAGSVVGSSYILFATFLVWFPALSVSAGVLSVEGIILLEGYMRTSREKRRFRLAFSRYVSPAVVDMLLARPELLEPGGEEVEATVLFSDLAGFTSLSESMAPGELMAMLSGYFTPMTAIIKENSGTLDKFIGDAIMAFWGAPHPDESHASHACRAALSMVKTLESLRGSWKAQGFPGLFARIGIHSGKVIAGNVGSREQVNYTCLGDTVNLASRLESVNKHYGTGILVSGETRAFLGPEFILRRVDSIRVKGRNAPVEVFELLSEGEPLPEWVTAYEKGLYAYSSQNFDQAQALFAQVLEQRPEDGPSGVMFKRCQNNILVPPEPGWDGVHVMESK
jgi:adenylate cyclase